MHTQPSSALLESLALCFLSSAAKAADPAVTLASGKLLEVSGDQPRIQDLAKGGAVLLEGRHIDNECMRSQGRIQKAGGGGGGGAVRFRPDPKAGGGGGGVLSVLGPIQTRGGGGGCCPFKARFKRGGGGGGCCLPFDDLYLGLCARA